MTERDTASLLRAALASRAEHGMQATNTEQELVRLREQMAPVRRRRRFTAALATAAVVAVVGGAVGLGVALVSQGGDNKGPGVARQPTPTRLPAGTVAPGFPLGSYQHPGGSGLTKLRITQHAVAFVSSPDGSARNVLTFTTPDIVTFDTLGLAGCSKPGRYTWTVANDELVLTAVDDACSERRIGLTEKPWGPVTRTQSGG